MKERLMRLLAILAVLTGATLMISNLAATKLWDFCGIAVDGGILIFPLSYIIGDITVEFFGKKNANTVIYSAFAINAVGAIVFLLVRNLPPHPEWPDQVAFETIFSFAPRITIASLMAFVCSNLVNNYIFEYIRKIKDQNQQFWQRALISSAAGRLIDSLIFEIVAFAGILSEAEFFKQIVFAYIAGCVLELALTPLSSFLVSRLHQRLDS